MAVVPLGSRVGVPQQSLNHRIGKAPELGMRCERMSKALESKVVHSGPNGSGLHPMERLVTGHPSQPWARLKCVRDEPTRVSAPVGLASGKGAPTQLDSMPSGKMR